MGFPIQPGPPPDGGVLRFPLLGFAVRIHPVFWLTMILMAATGRRGLTSIASFILVATVSVLFHELAHAVTARPWAVVHGIELHAFGGVTRFRPIGTMPWWKHAWVSFAGPLANLVLAFVVYQLRPVGPTEPWLLRVTNDFVFLNFAWAVLNLLPITPMDGGKIVESLFSARFPFAPQKATVYAAWVGVVVGAAVCAMAVYGRQVFLALLLGAMVYQQWTIIQAARDARRYRGWNSER